MSRAFCRCRGQAQDIEGIEEYDAFHQKPVGTPDFEWDASGTQSMFSALEAYGFDPEAIGAETAKMKGFPRTKRRTKAKAIAA